MSAFYQINAALVNIRDLPDPKLLNGSEPRLGKQASSMQDYEVGE